MEMEVSIRERLYTATFIWKQTRNWLSGKFALNSMEKRKCIGQKRRGLEEGNGSGCGTTRTMSSTWILLPQFMAKVSLASFSWFIFRHITVLDTVRLSDRLVYIPQSSERLVYDKRILENTWNELSWHTQLSNIIFIFARWIILCSFDIVLIFLRVFAVTSGPSVPQSTICIVLEVLFIVLSFNSSCILDNAFFLIILCNLE